MDLEISVCITFTNKLNKQMIHFSFPIILINEISFIKANIKVSININNEYDFEHNLA